MRHVIMVRRRLMGMGAALLTLPPLMIPAYAKDTGNAEWNLPGLPQNPRMTLEITETDLPQAFARVFQKADVNYIIHPDIPSVKATVAMRNKPLTVILQELCKLSDKPIAYMHRNGIYSVFPIFSPDRADWKEPSGRMWVNMGVKQIRLGPTIALMMEPFGMGCSVPPELCNQVVTVQINAPFEEALERLQKASGTSFQVTAEGNIRHFLPAGKKLPERPLIQGGEGAPGEPRITADFTDAVIAPSLGFMMRRHAGAKWEFHRDLTGATATIRLEDVPLSRALKESGKASSIPFTYEIRNGVYYFVPLRPSEKETKSP